MHYSFLPQFTSSFSAKPGTNNRPKVRFSASTAELSKFSEYNVPMTREMLHGDTFERRLESSSGKTVDTRQFADLVVQSINGFRQAPKRHFLVTAEGNGATGKTTTIQRLSDFIEQTDSADIKPITVSQGRTEMLDPHKQE